MKILPLLHPGKRHRPLVATVGLGVLLSACGGPRERNPLDDHMVEALYAPDRPYVPATRRDGRAGAPPAEITPGRTAAEPYVERGRLRIPEVRPAPPRGTGTITLSFDQADIRDVVRSVLGDTLGLTWAVDPAVEGTVTLEAPEPVPRDTVLALLDRALQLAGATLVPIPGGYQVVPLEGAAQAGLTPGLPPAGMGIEVVPLRHAGAEAIASLLAPVTPPGAAVAVDGERGLVLLVGTRGQIEALQSTIQALDIPRLEGLSFALQPLRFADPERLAAELETIFGTGETTEARFVPIPRLKSVVIVTRDPATLDRLLAWARRLDLDGGGDGPELQVYSIQNGRAEQMAGTLSAIFGSAGGGVDGGLQGDIAPGFGSRSIAAPLGAGVPVAVSTGGVTGTEVLPDYGDREAPDREPQARGGAVPPLAGAPRVVADERRNILLVQATRDQHREIMRILEEIDLPPRQVLIEATIAEVTLNDQLEYGVQWFFESGNFSTLLTQTSSGTVAPVLPGFAAVFDGSDARAVLSALASVTEVRVISSPQVMVLANQTAVLQVGDSVPVPVSQATVVTGEDPVIVNTIQFQDTGVNLEVTPLVSDGGLVTLEIQQDVSDAVQTTTSGIDAPTIQRRRIGSVVAVRSGSTIGLGGLIRNTRSVGRSGVPLLSDVPVVGTLFSTRSQDVRRTELLVLLRPRVVESDADVALATDELRRRMRGILPLDVSPPPPAAPQFLIPAPGNVEVAPDNGAR